MKSSSVGDRVLWKWCLVFCVNDHYSGQLTTQMLRGKTMFVTDSIVANFLSYVPREDDKRSKNVSGREICEILRGRRFIGDEFFALTDRYSFGSETAD